MPGCSFNKARGTRIGPRLEVLFFQLNGDIPVVRGGSAFACLQRCRHVVCVPLRLWMRPLVCMLSATPLLMWQGCGCVDFQLWERPARVGQLHLATLPAIIETHG